jgi:DNA polymerase III alpha subunit
MAFIGLEDASGQKIETIVFPKILEQYNGFWQEGNIVLVSGKISDKDGNLKIICDEVRLINQEEIERFQIIERDRKRESERANNLKKVFIRLPKNSSSETLRNISKILSSASDGNDKIYLEFVNGSNNANRLETPYCINYNKEVSEKIRKLLA